LRTRRRIKQCACDALFMLGVFLRIAVVAQLDRARCWRALEFAATIPALVDLDRMDWFAMEIRPSGVRSFVDRSDVPVPRAPSEAKGAD
jgi:hypothetical protein